MAINSYSTSGYCQLFYQWLLVAIILMIIMVILLMIIMAILLMTIGGYSINDYWWLFY